MFRVSCSALVIAAASTSSAWAQPEVSNVPTQAVYQYQLNYQLPWQRWWGGPGWSLGGTMPTQGVAGYSTMNGFPLPGPLGAGVYVNGPPPHAVMPGPGIGPAFGPGPVTGMGAMGMGAIGPSPGMAMGLGGMPGFAAAAGPMTNRSNVIPGSFQAPAQPNVARRAAPQASPPGARRASLEQQNQGDVKLRDSQWTQAYVNYRNAIDLAPERPEPHFRIALTFTALKQYSSAIREFKKSIDLDPTLPQSGDTLSMIFNGDTKAWDAQVMPVVTAWTSEDLRDGDRLFLLGLLLSFNEDPRGSEMMEAARRVGPNDYITAFLEGGAPAAPEPRRARTHLRRDPAPQPQPDDSLQHVPPSPSPLVEPDSEQLPAPEFPPM